MIDELLVMWRATPASEVAELIAQVSATDTRPPITGGSQRALHTAWLEVESANDPGDIDRLLAVLASGKLTQASERMERLARRPSDPRVAAGLEALLAAPPSAAFVKTASTKFWDAVCAELARIADPRTRSIAERAAWLANDRVPSPFDVGRNRARMAKAILKVAADIAPAPELPAAQRERIASLAARMRSIPKRVDRSAELLARIYEDPRDLDARAVYADWLIASGDPRGELIALQLVRPLPKQPPWRHFEHEREHKPSTREQQLLRVHAGAWLGRLGTSLENVSFERGFPAWAHLATDADIVTVALPEASTLEYLAVARDDFGTGKRLVARDPGDRAGRLDLEPGDHVEGDRRVRSHDPVAPGAARGVLAARARGARAGGARCLEQGDRKSPARRRGHGEESGDQHPRQAEGHRPHASRAASARAGSALSSTVACGSERAVVADLKPFALDRFDEVQYCEPFTRHNTMLPTATITP